MIVAKNKTALKFLSKEIKERKVEKKYLAICLDNLSDKEGEVSNLLVRHPQKRKQMAISKDRKRQRGNH